MIGSSLTSPLASSACSDSSVRRPPLAPSARSLACVWRKVAIWRAFAGSATDWNESPGDGSCSRPSTSTGVDGPATLSGRPRSSMSARTRPTTGPAMMLSPTRSEPSCTSTVATGPRPRSSLVSSTVPMRGALRVGLVLADFGDEQNHLEQQIEPGLLLRRDLDEHRRAAPFFGHEVEIGELALDRLGIGAGLVDLVHRDDDRHVRRARVIDRFPGLRHHAVVGRDDEDDDVGDARAAGAHRA